MSHVRDVERINLLPAWSFECPKCGREQVAEYDKDCESFICHVEPDGVQCASCGERFCTQFDTIGHHLEDVHSQQYPMTDDERRQEAEMERRMLHGD
jgi:transcription elongation factor Elf1